jgi:hypothetical protein
MRTSWSGAALMEGNVQSDQDFITSGSRLALTFNHLRAALRL